MNPLLERASRARDLIDPKERLLYRPLMRRTDLFAYGRAGEAVGHIFDFVQGLALAYGLSAPSLLALSPKKEGELATAWADRCSLVLLSWYRERFVGDAANDSSLDTRHRTPRVRA